MLKSSGLILQPSEEIGLRGVMVFLICFKNIIACTGL